MKNKSARIMLWRPSMQISYAKMRRCPYCGAEVRTPDAKFCWWCGRRLSEE